VTKYKLYSNLWKFEDNSKRTVLKNGGRFDIWKVDSLISIIDTVKIKKYLSVSFNEFRKDYGKSTVKFSDSLSKECEKFSRTLRRKYAHSDNVGYYTMECINLLPMTLLTSTKKVDGDINKIIAETIFDSFVCSDTHMDLLLSEKYKTFGVGLTFTISSINIVIRGMTK
jgi:hypothetical protein